MSEARLDVDRIGEYTDAAGHDVREGAVRQLMSTVIETSSRLVSIRDVLEHEAEALSRSNDKRLVDVLVVIEDLKLELSKTIAVLESEAD